MGNGDEYGVKIIIQNFMPLVPLCTAGFHRSGKEFGYRWLDQGNEVLFILCHTKVKMSDTLNISVEQTDAGVC